MREAWGTGRQAAARVATALDGGWWQPATVLAWPQAQHPLAVGGLCRSSLPEHVQAMARPETADEGMTLLDVVKKAGLGRGGGVAAISRDPAAG